ncbi:hypothetical protein PVAND_012661 [Polypedilum vanderplanki]|uniref:tRNA pseudouridine(55) synthase n=1 Tax=Polypedilum vanderplanki TaxID=319348 RepID=A0A9J6CN53_POLVA|nr:hypothetical protein PVAND_012661 [Polypedilum vanderplanki]
MSEGSVQESITCHVAPYFDALPSAVTFMSSGREDVDVRCLGRGRPFALEITDATKTTLDSSTAADIERKVCQSRVVSIRDLHCEREWVTDLLFSNPVQAKFVN